MATVALLQYESVTAKRAPFETAAEKMRPPTKEHQVFLGAKYQRFRW